MARPGRHWTRRVWILVGASAVLLIFIGAATFRSGWLRSRAVDTALPAIPDYPVEFRASQANYELKPKRDGVGTVLAAMRSEISDQLVGLGVGGAAAERLEETLISRVKMQLAPDYDTWRRLVGEAAPLGADPADPDNEEFQRVWNISASLFRNSPVGIDAIVVRRSEAGTEPNYEVPGTIFLRSGGPGKHAARYPDPEKGNEGVEVIETLIPMLYQLPKGEPLPVTVSFRFYRNQGDLDWKPTDLYLYFDQKAFGKGLKFPIN